jgi:hypothetical protein
MPAIQRPNELIIIISQFIVANVRIEIINRFITHFHIYCYLWNINK